MRPVYVFSVICVTLRPFYFGIFTEARLYKVPEEHKSKSELPSSTKWEYLTYFIPLHLWLSTYTNNAENAMYDCSELGVEMHAHGYPQMKFFQPVFGGNKAGRRGIKLISSLNETESIWSGRVDGDPMDIMENRTCYMYKWNDKQNQYAENEALSCLDKYLILCAGMLIKKPKKDNWYVSEEKLLKT